MLAQDLLQLLLPPSEQLPALRPIIFLFKGFQSSEDHLQALVICSAFFLLLRNLHEAGDNVSVV